MSTFAEMMTDAQESHDDAFGDLWEYRSNSDEEWQSIVARKYNERIEPRKFDHGWKRVKMFDLSISVAELEQPIMHSHVRLPDSEELATVTEFKKIVSGRWQLTCQNIRAGEISRPNLRRN